MASIVVALITGISLIAVQIIISMKQQRVTDMKHEYVIEEIKRDIRRLEDKQNKHNNVIERMAIVERDIKTAFTYIGELKEEVRSSEN